MKNHIFTLQAICWIICIYMNWHFDLLRLSSLIPCLILMIYGTVAHRRMPVILQSQTKKWGERNRCNCSTVFSTTDDAILTPTCRNICSAPPSDKSFRRPYAVKINFCAFVPLAAEEIAFDSLNG